MVFSSLFFVLFFLPLNLILYRFMPNIKAKNIEMLIFSLIFYSWGGPRYLILLIGMVFIAWGSAVQIEQNREDEKRKKQWMAAGCAGLVIVLGIFKYLTFLLGNVQAVFHVPAVVPQIVLPIGISFYTFQLISYVVDVYRGEVEAQKKYWMLLLYAGLFHQCIAGPIVRYEYVAKELEDRSVRLSGVGSGIRRFFIGLAKKAVLANSCASIADALLPVAAGELAKIPAAGLWVGVLMYMFQIYLDFSAYSDMAIGMGQMIGLHYEENFNYPYTAVSIKDFWRRWHMTLSSFFRDYVYIPLGGSRCSLLKNVRNLFVVWLLTGFWHGASWNYVLWGLYFFVFLLIERAFLGRVLEKIPSFFGHVYALIVIYFGWILFRSENLGNVAVIIKGMFGLNGNGVMDIQTEIVLKNNIFFMIYALLAVTPLFKKIKEWLLKWYSYNFRMPYPVYIGQVAIMVFLWGLSILALVGNSYNPFLYFQF
ncbi:MBOAT family O-acyltransferase [Clostridium sp. AM58-1XD]|uniref:MBOAT family O-acyltransferase n=1 Tax=Clostridium sp. AM58-1XD TaxID=2292307 RepID=UPI000E4D7DD5|nr:MBOAT family O-acyltransferase [Clostridium sp. AM58-1XD]RGZ00916.1 MBOAT family protein [Clostridium sp. AM58-1XD]